MSETLDARAERLKLARLLEAEPEQLDFLDGVSSADLTELREQVTERLFVSAPGLAMVGRSSRLVPSGLAAKIARQAFGPMLCARAAGAAEPAKAIDIARHLPHDFLAELTAHLDPRRVAHIIAGVPEEMVVAVATRMEAAEEFVTMGRFLAFIPDHALRASIGALSDEAMLRTAFVLEHKDRLEHAVGLLPPDRLPGIIESAAAHGLWPEALDLLDNISEERRGPIADVIADLDPDVVASLVDTAGEQGLWPSLLALVRLMSTPARDRVVALPALHRPEVLAAVVETAVADDLWADLLPLVAALPDDAHAGVLAQVDALPTEQRDRLRAALGDADLLVRT